MIKKCNYFNNVFLCVGGGDDRFHLPQIERALSDLFLSRLNVMHGYIASPGSGPRRSLLAGAHISVEKSKCLFEVLHTYWFWGQ